MKRKILALPAAIAAAVLCAFGVSACKSEEKTPTPHVHSYGEWTQVTPATCLQNGQDKRVCEGCGDEEFRVTYYTEGHRIENGECAVCHTPCTENLDFTAAEGGYTLSGRGEATDSDILVPDVHLGLPVKKIGAACFSADADLKSITIPDSVTEIELMAFNSNDGLESVALGNGVSTIAAMNFRGCTALKSISAGKNNPAYSSKDGILYNKGLTEICFVPQAVTTAELPDSLTEVADNAFADCSALTSVELGGNITQIGSMAFANTLITQITIPESAETIGNSAFSNCAELKTVTWNAVNCDMDRTAFQSCTALTDLYVGEEVTAMPNYAFSDAALENVYAASLSAWCNIGFTLSQQNPLYYAENENFYVNGEKVTEVEIPADVTQTAFTFAGCDQLEKVTFAAGSGLQTLGTMTFYGCSALTEVTLPEGLKEIGDSAFSNCSTLSCELNFPDSVTKIGDNAFKSCNALWNINFGAQSRLERIGQEAFAKTATVSFTVPQTVTFIGSWVFDKCSNLNKVTFLNTSGWQAVSVRDPQTTSPLTVTDPEQNAINIKGDYSAYNWTRG